MKVLPILARLATAFRIMSPPKQLSTTRTSTRLQHILPQFDRQTCQRRLFLLRHGETSWNAAGLMQGGGYDIPLNDAGLTQAACLAQELSFLPASVVASSHLQRAQQTAAQLLLSSEQPVVCLPEFGEMRFGELEGLALRGPQATIDTRNKFRMWNERMQLSKDFSWPGQAGESTADVEQRGLLGLQRLYESFPEEESFFIVAHGRFNKVLLASLLYGNPLAHPKIQQGNTCINVLDQRKDGSYSEVLLNYMNHINREED